MKLSVCIPTFNRAARLERAIRSALAQSHQDKEIVVCNNASSDDTIERVKRLANEFPKCQLRLINNPENVGMVANWRRCMENATGDFFMILDDDNFLIDGEYLTKVAALLQESPEVKLVTANFLIEQPGGRQDKAAVTLARVTPGIELYVRYFDPTIFGSGFFFVFYDALLARHLNIFSQDMITHDNEAFLLFMLNGAVGFIPDDVGVYDRTHGDNLDVSRHFFDVFRTAKRVMDAPTIYSVSREQRAAPFLRLYRILLSRNIVRLRWLTLPQLAEALQKVAALAGTLTTIGWLCAGVLNAIACKLRLRSRSLCLL